jgi:hypothetical protein
MISRRLKVIGSGRVGGAKCLLNPGAVYHFLQGYYVFPSLFKRR